MKSVQLWVTRSRKQTQTPFNACYAGRLHCRPILSLSISLRANTLIRNYCTISSYSLQSYCLPSHVRLVEIAMTEVLHHTSRRCRPEKAASGCGRMRHINTGGNPSQTKTKK